MFSSLYNEWKKTHTPAMRLYDSYIIYLLFLELSNILHCKACNLAEYEINGECCPMCSPGHHVLKHCNSYSGTNCKVCTGSTYTDVPNGLLACLPCTVCDEDSGLKVMSKCKYNSDAMCEPLPGHYCIEPQGESCRKAQEHSTCLPGQFIYKTGTTLMNTVCNDCSKETYSNGSFLHCEPHTNCDSLGQITITQGTPSSDAVCSHKLSHLGLIIGILLTLMLLILSVLVWRKRRKFIILCAQK